MTVRAQSQTKRRALPIAAALLWLGVLFQAEGCNAILGNDSWVPISADSGKDVGDDHNEEMPEGGSATDAPMDHSPPPMDGPATTDSPVEDSPTDVGHDSGLSSQLVVPPSGGSACDPAEGDGDCGSGETCRISSATGGTCDPYTGCEGHEAGYPCSFDSDCDDHLQCYKGECFVLCPLGETCSGGCECFTVGNETTGLCCPGM
jgi:hypothetical protein